MSAPMLHGPDGPELRAIHAATNAALERGFTVEIHANGHLRFRKGRDTGTAQVLDDGAKIGNWRTGRRASLDELRDALSAPRPAWLYA